MCLYARKYYPHLGSSPDGVVQIGNETCLFEIKRPFKWRLSTIHEATKDPQFCSSRQAREIHLKTKPYILLTNTKAMAVSQICDCFIWTLKDCDVDRIHWEGCINILKALYMYIFNPW